VQDRSSELRGRTAQANGRRSSPRNNALRSRWNSGKLVDVFVIELQYTAALAAIDARMAAHVKFLKKYYASGHFLVSGRKIPRDGGIILAVARSRQEIEQIMNEDPFRRHGLADVRIIEFRDSQRADDFPERPGV
jgi:uncharacterized protein YciI